MRLYLNHKKIIHQLNTEIMEAKKITLCSFCFEITQTTKVLKYKIDNGDGRRWNVENDGTRGYLSLCEIENPENKTLVLLGDNYMKIVTCSGYEYVVEDKEGDGANVTFSGPVNALLTQALMPRMTYVPQTLQGLSSDMDDYQPIAEFMRIRAERNADNPNPQDQQGWRVNMKFANELVPYLPPFTGDLRESPKQARRHAKKAEKTGKFCRR